MPFIEQFLDSLMALFVAAELLGCETRLFQKLGLLSQEPSHLSTYFAHSLVVPRNISPANDQEEMYSQRVEEEGQYE
jgi:hypothetical protein